MEYNLVEEIELKNKLDVLFEEWKDTIRQNGESENLDTSEVLKSFVTDGFFPYYTAQKIKILFIGRESVGISGADYPDLIYKAAIDDWFGEKDEDGKRTKGQTLNQHKFTNRCFYISYGMNNNVENSYSGTMPRAKELLNSFSNQHGFSYAFMNLSKISNELDTGHLFADKSAIQNFIMLSKSDKNLFRREVELLAPDVIITMNIASEINSCFEIPLKYITSNGPISIHETTIGHKSIPLIDTYHFSCRKGLENTFYKPIREELIKRKLI